MRAPLLFIAIAGVIVTTGFAIPSARADFSTRPPEYPGIPPQSHTAGDCQLEQVRLPGEECTHCDVNLFRPTCEARFRSPGWERRCSTFPGAPGENYEIWCRPLAERAAPERSSARPRSHAGCAASPGTRGGPIAVLFAIELIRARRTRGASGGGRRARARRR